MLCENAHDIESLPQWETEVLEALYAEAERGDWPWREPSEEEAAKLRHRFLAQVVRALWGESSSYEVMNQGDAGVARAVHALLDEEAFFRTGGTVSLSLTNHHSITNSNNQEHGF